MPVIDLNLVSLFTISLAAIITIAGAISDARHFRLPNWTSLSLIALFPLYGWTKGETMQWLPHLAIAGIVLAAGFALYAAKIAGAGDAKLLAAISLWAGTDHILLFLFITAIAGGLLSLAIILLHHIKQTKTPPNEPEKTPLTKIQIPYGIAIACGGLCLFITLSPLGTLSG